MAHEIVPADIAAAIDSLELSYRTLGSLLFTGPVDLRAKSQAAVDRDRAALNAAILHHLRAYDEMKAALELQTSGGA